MVRHGKTHAFFVNLSTTSKLKKIINQLVLKEIEDGSNKEKAKICICSNP